MGECSACSNGSDVGHTCPYPAEDVQRLHEVALACVAKLNAIPGLVEAIAAIPAAEHAALSMAIELGTAKLVIGADSSQFWLEVCGVRYQ